MLYMAFAPSTSIFFIAVAVGVIFGMLWDCFRIVRLRIINSKKIVFILDILYFCLVSVLTVWFFFLFTSGGFRFFVVVGEILGFIFYYSTIQNMVYLFLNFILNIVFKIIFLNFYFIKKCFLRFIVFFETKVLKIIKSVLNMLEYYIYNKNKSNLNKSIFKIKNKGLIKNQNYDKKK